MLRNIKQIDFSSNLTKIKHLIAKILIIKKPWNNSCPRLCLFYTISLRFTMVTKVKKLMQFRLSILKILIVGMKLNSSPKIMKTLLIATRNTIKNHN